MPLAEKVLLADPKGKNEKESGKTTSADRLISVRMIEITGGAERAVRYKVPKVVQKRNRTKKR